MSGPVTTATEVVTYVLDGDGGEALTSVVQAGEAEAGGLGALEALAAYLYDDLRALARANPDALAEALRAPEEAAEDANLFLKLVCADLEQLLREQHVRAVALVVSGPDAVDAGRRHVSFRALYRVERPLQLGDSPEETALPRLTRREGERPLKAHLTEGAELALLLDWTPQAVKRGPLLRRPPYQLLWVRAAAARFDGERAQAAAGLPGPVTASGAGGWYVAAVAAPRP